MADVLVVDSVSHHFGGLKVLQNINLKVADRSFVGLIGPNGSGKTTLFNIVTGFLTPAEGRVFFDGQDMSGLPVEARSRAGLVRTFQTPHVFDNMSVLENVMTGCHKITSGGFVSSMLALPQRGRDLALARERATASCMRFGFARDLDAPASSLPAGRRRLLELARACVGEPKMLLLDEPSSGLTSPEIKTLVNWLHDIHQSGITLLLVSHHMELMDAVGNVSVLDFGRIIGNGSLQEVKAMPHVQKAYLGTEVGAIKEAADVEG
jgi:ABC-type branched-subunit amino acid transport system ATPase component